MSDMTDDRLDFLAPAIVKGTTRKLFFSFQQYGCKNMIINFEYCIRMLSSVSI